MSSAAPSVSSRTSTLDAFDPAWRDLIRIAGWAALLTAIFLPVQIAVFIIWPPPAFEPTLENTLSWFAFFNANPLLGLLDLDLLIIVDVILGVPVTLALAMTLRKVNQSIAALGLIFGLIATVSYLAASPTIAMLGVSQQYAAATTEAGRAAAVTAGQVLLANNQGTSFQVFYILGSAAPLLFCLLMLRSNLYSRWIAWIGIAANVIAMGLYVPEVGIYISVFSVLFLWVYHALIARRFLAA